MDDLARLSGASPSALLLRVQYRQPNDFARLIRAEDDALVGQFTVRCLVRLTKVESERRGILIREAEHRRYRVLQLGPRLGNLEDPLVPQGIAHLAHIIRVFGDKNQATLLGPS